MYRLSCFILFVLITIFMPFSLSYANSAGQTSFDLHRVQVGIEGYYKSGHWTQVTIDWSCPAEMASQRDSLPIEWVVSSVDSDGTPINYRYQASGRTTVFQDEQGRDRCRSVLYVKLGRKSAAFRVSILLDQEEKASQTLYSSRQDNASGSRFFEPVADETPIFLVIGNEDIGLQGAIAELALRKDRRPFLVKVRSMAELPDQWFGYESIEMVVLTTTEPSQFASLDSSSAVIHALDEWVRLGGRLLFCAGAESGPFLEPENGALRPFLPGKFEKMTDLRHGTPFEVYLGSKRQIFMNGTDAAPFMKMPQVSDPKGIVFVRDGDSPLLSRHAHGLGVIIYFAGDLSEKPLKSWKDRIPLVMDIMQWDRFKQVTTREGLALIQLGYSDISGQIRSALDRFDGIYVIPFSVILLILSAYWLAIGPLDWYLAHRFFKRPGMTWITFPFWIILFCFVALFLLRNDSAEKIHLNELSIVDVDTETGTIRSSLWAGLYSPNDLKYRLSQSAGFPTAPADSEVLKMPSLLSWNGLPGSGLGGMAPKTVSPTVWNSAAEQHFVLQPTAGAELTDTIDEIPVQIRSTKSFFGQSWSFSMPEQICLPTAKMRDEEGIPVGEIHWPERMPTLDQVVLAYQHWAFELGTLEPGKSIRFGKTTPRRELRDLLVPSDILDDQNMRQIAFYQPQSTDLSYITRTMTFHAQLGGSDATGLHHLHRRSLDMSDLFTVDRVILFGIVRQGQENSFGAEMTATLSGPKTESAQSKRLVVYRQSFPIELVPGISPRLKVFRQEIKEDELKDKDTTIGPAGEYKLE